MPMLWEEFNMEKILKHNELSIEKSRSGRRGVRFEKAQKEASGYLPSNLLRTQEPRLPEMS